MSNNRKALIATVIAMASGLIVFLMGNVVTSSAKTDDGKPNPLFGSYHQINNDIPDTTMTATIAENSIVIVLKLESHEEGDADPAGTYWAGTFDTDNKSDSFITASLADSKELSYSVLGSQDRTKTFTYDQGIISFNFSIMGQSTTVQLSK